MKNTLPWPTVQPASAVWKKVPADCLVVTKSDLDMLVYMAHNPKSPLCDKEVSERIEMVLWRAQQ